MRPRNSFQGWRDLLLFGLAVAMLSQVLGVIVQGQSAQDRPKTAADQLLEEVMAALQSGGDEALRIWMRANKDRVGTDWIGQLAQRGIKQRDEKLLKAAILLAEEKGDGKTLGGAYLAAGDFYQSGNPRAALDFYAKALPLFEKAKDPAGQANAYFGQGRVYNLFLQDQRKALECLNRALALRRALGDRAGEAAALVGIGHALHDLGEIKRAVEHYEQSLLIRRALGDKIGEARNLNYIGICYFDLGELHKAIELYQQAQALFRALGDRVGEAQILNNLGLIHTALGERRAAIEFYLQALSIHGAVGDRRSESIALNNIGNLYFEFGEFPRALEYLTRALQGFQALGHRAGESGVLNNIGAAYNYLGEYQKALEHFSQALTIERALEFKSAEAATLSNIGETYHYQGDQEEALKNYGQALSLARAVGDRNAEAKILNNMGDAYLSLAKPQDALEHFHKALPIARSVGTRPLEAFVSRNLMRTWHALSKPRLAVLYGKHAVALCQQLRADIRDLDVGTQQAYLKVVVRAYRELADILAGQGRLWEAQQVLALLKEQEYFEYVRRDMATAKALLGRADLSPAESAALSRYEAVAEKVTAVGRRVEELRAVRARTKEQEAELSRLREDLIAAGRAFEVALRQIEDDLGGNRGARDVVETLRATKGLSLDLRSLNIVVLSTIVAEKTVWVILTTPTTQVAGRTDIPEEELNRQVLAFREALQDRDADPRPLARKFYDILIKPVEGAMTAASPRTVAWMLDGTLRYLPVAALFDGERYLVERFASVIITLASRSRLGSTPGPAWRALGLGVTEAHEEFEALPAVADELKAVVQEQSSEGGALPGRRLMDRDFTRQALEEGREGGFQVVHIASHFMFKKDALESFLLLGDGSRLTVEDMRLEGGLFAGVELLTLSACNTAMGGERVDGREVEGLGVEAQNQGAQAVLAALWPVADESTAQLMAHFYKWRQDRELMKDEALRQAQLALLRGGRNQTGEGVRATAGESFRHPCFWAPFILIGNWK